LNGRRVNVRGSRLNIDEDGGGTAIDNCFGSSDEGIRGGDHLVAFADTSREQRQMQRAGSGIQRNTVLHLAIFRESLLETLHFLTQNEARVQTDAVERLPNFVAQQAVLGLQVEIRDCYACGLHRGLRSPTLSNAVWQSECKLNNRVRRP
jgi:hypothetical protein